MIVLPSSRAGTPRGSAARRGARLCRVFGLIVAAAVVMPPSAAAQGSVTEVLSFLLTNRSIGTNDATRDAAAAAATRDAISQFLLLELATVPTVSSSSGFTYRVEQDLGGAVVRSTDSFGPSFVERSLTAGALRPAVGIAYQDTSYDRIDARPLSDGTLVAIASRLQGEATPFDVETLSVNLRTRTLTLTTNVGLTDRVDVSAAVPLIRLTLDGERVDTLRGVSLVQASARADASGVGDVRLRVKYNAVRAGGSGMALGAEARLPSGDPEQLLGAGEASFEPRAIGSFERGRVSGHGEIGYSFGGLSRVLSYGGAATIIGSARLTFVGEFLGRRVETGGRLAEEVAPHPTLAGIETIRLTAVGSPTHRAALAAGVKWNVTGTWLISASVLRSLTSAGLTSSFVPSVALEYAFDR